MRVRLAECLLSGFMRVLEFRETLYVRKTEDEIVPSCLLLLLLFSICCFQGYTGKSSRGATWKP